MQAQPQPCNLVSQLPLATESPPCRHPHSFLQQRLSASPGQHAPPWEGQPRVHPCGSGLSVGAFAHTNGCALPWAPAAAALPSSTSGPLIYATRGAVHSLVPRLAAALSPGGFPTAAFGKKGPFSGRQ